MFADDPTRIQHFPLLDKPDLLPRFQQKLTIFDNEQKREDS